MATENQQKEMERVKHATDIEQVKGLFLNDLSKDKRFNHMTLEEANALTALIEKALVKHDQARMKQ